MFRNGHSQEITARNEVKFTDKKLREVGRISTVKNLGYVFSCAPKILTDRIGLSTETRATLMNDDQSRETFCHCLFKSGYASIVKEDAG